MCFVDSHIHLSDSAYDGYLMLMVGIINNLKIRVFSVSEDLESSVKNLNIKKKHFVNSDSFKAFVGIHPQHACAKMLESFNDFFLRNTESVDGIGEIGLDPTYTTNNGSNSIESQRTVFSQMLSIAERNNKPVSIHSRRSLKEVLDILPSYRLKRVVFHWYDGNKSFLNKINESGYYVSFGPYLLYSEDKKILLTKSDLSLLLLETDGPVSYRHCFNNSVTSPVFIISLLNFVSNVLKKNFNDVSERIFRNSVDFLDTK
jgi:TatD DNase family protein